MGKTYVNFFLDESGGDTSTFFVVGGFFYNYKRQSRYEKCGKQDT
ncbi:hypothetical protein NPX79_01715 [Spiroplasma endosymbiont of Anurida maritima]